MSVLFDQLNQELKKLYDKVRMIVESSKNGCMTRGSRTRLGLGFDELTSQLRFSSIFFHSRITVLGVLRHRRENFGCCDLHLHAACQSECT